MNTRHIDEKITNSNAIGREAGTMLVKRLVNSSSKIAKSILTEYNKSI
jgi:hypothetical protein